MRPRQIFIELRTVDLLAAVEDLPVEIACLEMQDGVITDNFFYHAMTADQPFQAVAEKLVAFIANADIFFLNTQKNIKIFNRELHAAEKKPLREHVKSITNISSLTKILAPQVANQSLPSLAHHFKVDCKEHDDKSALKNCVLLAKVYQQVLFLQLAQSKHRYAPGLRNPLLDRSFAETTFLDEEKVVQPLKTAMLINQNTLPLTKTKRFLSSLSSIVTHRPIEKITATSEAGSPIEVCTPNNNTALKRVANYDAFAIFSNHPAQKVESKPLSEIDEANDFFQSKQFREIKKIKETVKSMQVDITPELLANAKAQRYQDEAQMVKKVLPSRGLLMSAEKKPKAASAKNYANATQLFSDKLRWEWLPLVGFMILGNDSETEKNIVAGSAQAATMLMLNNSVHELAKFYPDGFTLNVKANLMKDTHIASTIEYEIQTKDFKLPLVFNAQTENRPLFNYEKYLSCVVQELINRVQHKADQSDKLAFDKSVLFFGKKHKAEKVVAAAAAPEISRYNMRSREN